MGCNPLPNAPFAVIAGGWIGNQLVPFLSIAIISISRETGLLALGLAYALGGLSLGYGMHQLWRSPLAKWVWIAGALWFGLRGLIGSSLSADLAAASGALPPDEAAVLMAWALYGSVAILAGSYSLGAWLHARFAAQPDTLTTEAVGDPT